MPDLVIFEPRAGYHALFLELKAESPFRKDGRLKKSDHLKGQADSILKLRGKGYYADFYWRFDMVMNVITRYINGDSDWLEQVKTPEEFLK